MAFFKRLRSYFTLNNGVLAVALLLAGAWAWSTVEAVQRNFKLQQQVDLAKQEIALHELENKTLELQKKYYQSAEYHELSARQRLNKALPGEKLLILPPNTVKPAQDSPSPEAAQPLTEQSNFEQWMYFLFGEKRG